MRNLTLFLLIALISCNGADEKDNVEIETKAKTIEPDKTEITSVKNTEIVPGEYFEYHPSGGIKIRGFYNNDLKREGLWLSYYENGTKWSEAYYSNGQRDGHNITFYPNGKIRFVGEYKNDIKTGKWTFYDEAGEITKIENY